MWRKTKTLTKDETRHARGMMGLDTEGLKISAHIDQTYTREKAQDLIERASEFMEYGPDYDRNIADAAADVVSALVRNAGVSTFSGILSLRLAGKAVAE